MTDLKIGTVVLSDQWVADTVANLESIGAANDLPTLKEAALMIRTMWSTLRPSEKEEEEDVGAFDLVDPQGHD